MTKRLGSLKSKGVVAKQECLRTGDTAIQYYHYQYWGQCNSKALENFQGLEIL